METQLVRLDSPYNIIMGTDGNVELHIATLIVVKERKEGVIEGVPMKDTLSVCTYPVVSGKMDVGGQVWMHTELKDCHLICAENAERIPILELKNVMEYCAKHNVPHYKEYIPMSFFWKMRLYKIKIELLKDTDNHVILDYKIGLEFEENVDVCMVYSSVECAFYFYEYFTLNPSDSTLRPSAEQAIKYLSELRDNYLLLFRYEGLKSLTFYTNKKQYQWFVDKLNNTKADDE